MLRDVEYDDGDDDDDETGDCVMIIEAPPLVLSDVDGANAYEVCAKVARMRVAIAFIV